MHRFRLLAFIIGFVITPAHAGDGKLLATAGVTQVEGSGGGGIVPWATLAGHDTRDEISASAFATHLSLDDYRLNALGIAVGLFDRAELSASQQTFDLTTLGGDIRQNVIGLKVRAYGDVVYSKWPQISLGIQHKTLLDKEVATLVGADDNDRGTDYYVSMTKVHLGALAGYNVLWNANLRATRANQMGLLGFGGTKNDDYKYQFEGSLGVLMSQHLVVGVEYRQMPDNLGLDADDWRDFYIAYIPNKQFSLTAAWADLGTVAGAKDQTGLYLSLTGYLW